MMSSENKRFRLMVFGKEGCDKCKVLKSRLEKTLADEKYSDFEMQYLSLGTLEGLIEFSQSEVLNPQRIPSFMVMAGGKNGNYRPISMHGLIDDLNGADLTTYLRLETDYSTDGVITPKMIREVLDTAKVHAESSAMVV